MRNGTMIRLLTLLLTSAAELFRSRRDLVLENLALRQQLAVLTQKRDRPRLASSDPVFWVLLRRQWTGWKGALVFMQPWTVLRWHRAGFELYWKWLSRKHAVVGRKPTSQELRDRIFRMVAENPTRGAPPDTGNFFPSA
jgi:putative transposase